MIQNEILPAFNGKNALDHILPLAQHTLMHAGEALRIDAAGLYKYAIFYTGIPLLKLQASKLAGSLIRVVNDKFGIELKKELFTAMMLLMKKAGPFIKAFAGPIQTTVMKAINDPEVSSGAREIILENVAELIKLNPKYDMLLNELLTTINNGVNAGTAVKALDVIGNVYFATMKQEVKTKIVKALKGYLAKVPEADAATTLAMYEKSGSAEETVGVKETKKE